MTTIVDKFDELYPEEYFRFLQLDGDASETRQLMLNVFRNGADCAFENALQTAQTPTFEAMEKNTLANILAWVDSRIEAEVTHRPKTNIYYETLNNVWQQVRKFVVARQKECAP